MSNENNTNVNNSNDEEKLSSKEQNKPNPDIKPPSFEVSQYSEINDKKIIIKKTK